MADYDSCEDKEKFYAVEDTFGGERPVPSCNPAAERVPDELREPEGDLEPVKVYRAPEPIRVVNLQQSATCRELYPDESDPNYRVYGKGTVVSAGTYEDSVHVSLSSIGITAEQGDYIAVHGLEADAGDLFNKAASYNVPKGRVVEQLAGLLHIEERSADALYDMLATAQGQLNVMAKDQAVSELECYWFNMEVTESCDPETYVIEDLATPDDRDDAVITYTVPDGFIRSDVSQEAADYQAEMLAADRLKCFYISDPVTVDCTDPDRPGKPDDGGDEPVPTEAESEIPSRREEPRVGYVHLPKGLYVSDISKEDATSKAREYAYSLLVCYYFNGYVRRMCGLSEARSTGVDPLLEPAAQADISLMTKGQEVVVPPGYIVTDISTEYANARAVEIADSLLQCCYISPEITKTCPDVLLVDDEGNPIRNEKGEQIRVSPSEIEGYAVPSKTVPRGAFSVCVTGDPTSIEDNKKARDEAIRLAEAAAEGELECIYCNKMVLPSCVPEWVIEAATKGITMPGGEVYKIRLPLRDPVINPFTGEVEDTSAWSNMATAGFSEGVYCMRDFYAAQHMADVDAARLVVEEKDEEPQCTFGNSTTYVTCCGLPAVAEETKAHGDVAELLLGSNRYKCVTPVYNPRTKKSGYAYAYACDKDGKSVCNCATNVAIDSYPQPCDYVEVPPNTVMVDIAEKNRYTKWEGNREGYDAAARKAKLMAEQLAADIGMGQICCKREPVKITGVCGYNGMTSRTEYHNVSYKDMPSEEYIAAHGGIESFYTHSATVKSNGPCCGCTRSMRIEKKTGVRNAINSPGAGGPPIEFTYSNQACMNRQFSAHRGDSILDDDDLCDNPSAGTNTYSETNAYKFVESLIHCFYGNDEVDGWCYSDGSTETFNANEPLVPRNTIITDLFYTSQNLAERLADEMAQCMYGNDVTMSSCKCKKSEYKDQLKKWEYLRMIKAFRCGKMKKNKIFAASRNAANRLASELSEELTQCRIDPCEDKTPFKVSFKCDPEDPCDVIEDEKARERCEKKEKDRELDYSDCIVKMHHGMIRLSNSVVVHCPEAEFPKGTMGKLSVGVKRKAGSTDYECVHLVDGKEVAVSVSSEESTIEGADISIDPPSDEDIGGGDVGGDINPETGDIPVDPDDHIVDPGLNGFTTL